MLRGYKGLVLYCMLVHHFLITSKRIFAKGYVHKVLEVLSDTSLPDLNSLGTKYSAMVPEPLSHQFANRRDKQSAVQRRLQRQEYVVELFPCGKDIFLLANLKNIFNGRY